MTGLSRVLKVAILDDYLGAADAVVRDSVLSDAVEITVFRTPVPIETAAEVLKPYEVVCLMRDRMVFPTDLASVLPALRLLILTGEVPGLNIAAATRAGVRIVRTPAGAATPRARAGPVELAWAMILSLFKSLSANDSGVRAGKWQTQVGLPVFGATIGLVGLGRVGRQMVPIAKAFGMNVLAYSPRLAVSAAPCGVQLVALDTLLAESDVVSLHARLTPESVGLIGRRELSLMKPSAFLINTARGLLIDEEALLSILCCGQLAGAGLDVHIHEPLGVDHPFTGLDNVLLSPHIGFVSPEMLDRHYRNVLAAVAAYAEARPTGLRAADVQTGAGGDLPGAV